MPILVTGVNGMLGYPMALKFAKLGRRVIGLDIEIPSELEKNGDPVNQRGYNPSGSDK